MSSGGSSSSSISRTPSGPSNPPPASEATTPLSTITNIPKRKLALEAAAFTSSSREEDEGIVIKARPTQQQHTTPIPPKRKAIDMLQKMPLVEQNNAARSTDSANHISSSRGCAEADWNKENLPVSTSSNDGIAPLEEYSVNKKLRSCLSSPGSLNLLKRPLSVSDYNSKMKRRRGMDLEDIKEEKVSLVTGSGGKPPAFHRSLSEANTKNLKQDMIKKLCFRADSCSDITADFAAPLALSIKKVGLKHQELNTIDCHTLASVVRGEMKDKIRSVRIIDARYRYEFDGGHIMGAENFGGWDLDGFFKEFLPDGKPPKQQQQQAEEEESTGDESKKADIIVFHCEFSSKRGPKLMKDLRQR